MPSQEFMQTGRAAIRLNDREDQNEDRADIVLDAVEPTGEHFAVLHQTTVLTLLLVRDVNGHELIQRSQFGQLQRIVTVGLSFDDPPPPGFLIRIADQHLIASAVQTS